MNFGMVLETLMKSCMTKPYFWDERIIPRNWPKKDQKLKTLKIWSLILFWFILFAVFLNKSVIWGKSGSWDMGQNALSQLDCRIFKSTISLEQNDEIARFFACWYNIKFSINFANWMGVIRNLYDHYGDGTLWLFRIRCILKLGAIKWFFACCYKFRKAKR